MNTDIVEVHTALGSINSAWREGHPLSMLEYLHPDMTMALPGFSGSVRGRDAILASFMEFCANAKVIEYEEGDEHIDVIGDSAVAAFRFRMLYERAAYREISTGRDVWVFHRDHDRWSAVWRTMIELSAERSAKQ
jgi:hypothetical protein